MEYLYPLIALFVLLAAFHLLFIYWFPQSKRFWKKVDYWWVSLGIVGIIGSSFTYIKEVSTAWTPFHKSVLESVLTHYQESLDNDALNLSDSSFQYFQAKTVEQKRMILNTCRLLDTLKVKISESKDLILKGEQYYLVDSITKPYLTHIEILKDEDVLDLCKSSSFMCQRTKEEANKLIELQENSNRGEFNWILLLVSPYLFGMAIAIRLTKVTAELKDIERTN